MTAFWWALLTAGIWGVVPLLEKLGIGRSEPLPGVIARSLGVVVGIGVLGLLRPPWAALRELSPQAILLLASGGFLASVVGQMAFYQALKSGAVSTVTPVAGAYPLVAAVLGWMVLREPLGIGRVLGALLIVVGVWLLRR